MKRYSCLLIDDDDFAREILEDFLKLQPDIEVLRSIGDSKTAIKHISILKPDLVFLDINMPNKDGMFVFNEIRELGLDSKVIFVTAHDEYLLEALRKNAFDYLIKPIKSQELEESLERFRSETQVINTVTNHDGEDSDRIAIKNSYGSLYLQSDDILYVEADGCYSNVYLHNGKKEVVSRNLGKIEQLFPEKHFFKISRSFIININSLNKIDRLHKTVQLQSNGAEVKLKATRDRLYDLEAIISKK